MGLKDFHHEFTMKLCSQIGVTVVDLKNQPKYTLILFSFNEKSISISFFVLIVMFSQKLLGELDIVSMSHRTQREYYWFRINLVC